MAEHNPKVMKNDAKLFPIVRKPFSQTRIICVGDTDFSLFERITNDGIVIAMYINICIYLIIIDGEEIVCNCLKTKLPS